MGIKDLQKKPSGFTIVEMIVVVIVIGIIVGIVIVSYSSITRSSNQQSLQADLKTAASKLTSYRADNGAYPTTLSAASVTNSSTTSYTYTYTAVSDTYCLVATGYSQTFYVVSSNNNPISGSACT